MTPGDWLNRFIGTVLCFYGAPLHVLMLATQGRGTKMSKRIGKANDDLVANIHRLLVSGGGCVCHRCILIARAQSGCPRPCAGNHGMA